MAGYNLVDIDVYGFGSYFTRKEQYNDIDLLLIHHDSSQESCLFAIRCKDLLKKKIPLAHIVMLSRAENIGSNFSIKAYATKIGTISNDEDKIDKDTDKIVRLITNIISTKK